MKVKTTELTGLALDWAVAKCEGHQWRCAWILEKEGLAAWLAYERAWGNPHPSYSTDWSQGGPIIERDRIHVYPGPQWTAVMKPGHFIYGLTPLIAAMRCYVASKLGNEVDIPDELLCAT